MGQLFQLDTSSTAECKSKTRISILSPNLPENWNFEMNYLTFPYEDPIQWENIVKVLSSPLEKLGDLDWMVNQFASGQSSTFFSTVPGSPDAEKFDFDSFWKFGAPFLVDIALKMPSLFEGQKFPVLVAGSAHSIHLSRPQCACLLAHSLFGSITSTSRQVGKEKWSFRAAQLLFLQSLPSAFCLLNYFKILGRDGFAGGQVLIERSTFPKNNPPWDWSLPVPLCSVEVLPSGSIAESPADVHADFANRFVGGGCLENDVMMEEILFLTKPELILSMAFCTFMHDEDVIAIEGARQYSVSSGYSHSFTFEGDYKAENQRTPRVVAMDAIQGMSKIQFQEGLVRRDLNKARLAFNRAQSVATGNWGCGAFGNDHLLKFFQQWLAASSAGVSHLYYYTYADKRAAEIPLLVEKFSQKTVPELLEFILETVKSVTPGPMASSQWKAALLK